MNKADAGGGAIIYIVLAVISLIVSAVGKHKRKEFPSVPTRTSQVEPNTSPPEQQKSWQKDLEDIFGKAPGEPEIITEKPEFREPLRENGNAREVVIDAKPSKVEEWNKYAISAKKKITDHSEPVEIIVLEDTYELAGVTMEEFDLRKAVIYSEILNRKYF